MIKVAEDNNIRLSYQQSGSYALREVAVAQGSAVGVIHIGGDRRTMLKVIGSPTSLGTTGVVLAGTANVGVEENRHVDAGRSAVAASTVDRRLATVAKTVAGPRAGLRCALNTRRPERGLLSRLVVPTVSRG